jgi:hypothetical protein
VSMRSPSQVMLSPVPGKGNTRRPLVKINSSHKSTHEGHEGNEGHDEELFLN